MTHLNRLTVRRIAIVILILFFTACRSSAPVNFYTLNSSEKPSTAPEKIESLPHLTIGIGTVALPDYLDRPQIVTLTAPHRLNLSEFNRWAGPLKEEITQVLIENLSTLLGTAQVVEFPWDPSEMPQFRVDLFFRHFEGSPGNTFRMEGSWRLSGSGLKGPVMRNEFSQTVKITGMAYEALAVAGNQALWKLSQEIDAKIRAATAVSSRK